MTSFESDYNNGAHPDVLQHLIETNNSPSVSYGYDEWSELAREKIRLACQAPEAVVQFLVGGTQTNATVIDALLPSYAGVIATETAHINVHESGAIEASGHKVITLPSHNGKMDAEDLCKYLKTFHADPTWEHMVFPGMVYITFPTELGTVYQAAEIEQIYSICQQYNIPLFIDGARLGYGLASTECNFDLPWLAHHCNAFYIGGTKVGALCGEAVVFPQGKAPHMFFTIVKRHGALLAKGRLVGIQFNALFSNNLYLKISQYVIEKAMRLRQLFIDAGFPVKDSPTNQQFVILTNQQKEKLMSQVLFETWETIDTNHTLCRFVTSWATTETDLKELQKAINRLKK
ncbi:MAG: aminotransferase class I/II-fold pyridoxal phosphate-dependent enzyme [Bacteroidaceae bacterium]|nr:aminotransferase class I/II-fold pyridoxal phosphate-dependent enzyme [Bacteroidaceae bacterium]